MKIGIDISSIVYGTGVSLYTSNLVRALIQEFPGDDIRLYGSSFRQLSSLHYFKKSIGRKIKSKFFPLPPKIQSTLFNQIHAPIELFTGSLDVFHSWDWYTPGTIRAGLVTTIHDLTALKYPQCTHPEIVRKHKKALSWIKKEAKSIIAVSRTTKQDIIDILGIDEGIIHVIPEALPEERKIQISSDEVTDLKLKYGITKPYILSVASQEPRKNLNSIVKAHQKIKGDVDLVLVGRSGFDNVEDKNGVIKTGYVSDQELAAFYKGAEVFVYPSIYEGFGLPILEAFYYHTPVVTSNISSMPEVAGDAAILINPMSVSSIVGGIQKAMKRKTKLIQAGLMRLDEFSWENVARETMKVYEVTYGKK